MDSDEMEIEVIEYDMMECYELNVWRWTLAVGQS